MSAGAISHRPQVLFRLESEEDGAKAFTLGQTLVCQQGKPDSVQLKSDRRHLLVRADSSEELHDRCEKLCSLFDQNEIRHIRVDCCIDSIPNDPISSDKPKLTEAFRVFFLSLGRRISRQAQGIVSRTGKGDPVMSRFIRLTWFIVRVVISCFTHPLRKSRIEF